MLNFDLALCGNRAAPYIISKSALLSPGNAHLCKPLPIQLLAMGSGRNPRGDLPTHFSGRSALGQRSNAPNGYRRVYTNCGVTATAWSGTTKANGKLNKRFICRAGDGDVAAQCLWDGVALVERQRG